MLKRRHGRGEFFEARDPCVDVAEHLPHLAHRLGQPRVRVDVVVADHEEQCVAVGVRRQPVEDARGLRPDAAAEGGGILVRETDERKRVRVVVDEMSGADAVARRRFPPELTAH